MDIQRVTSTNQRQGDKFVSWMGSHFDSLSFL